MKFSSTVFGIMLGVAMLAASGAGVASPVQEEDAARASEAFPGKEWQRVASPESVGYSSRRLQAVAATCNRSTKLIPKTRTMLLDNARKALKDL